MRRAGEFGVRVGEPVVDLPAVVARKDEIVDSIRDGSYRAVERAESMDHYPAEGRFVGPRRLRVGDTELEADQIFLVTGMRTTVPAIDGLDAVPYHTSRTLLDLTELPEHLVVVGGGYIGCEFAQMFRRFGSRITLVQRAERMLPGEDPDISAAVADGFAAEGIEVRTGTACVAVSGRAGDIRAGCAGERSDEVRGSHLLIAAGRTPNTDRLGLDLLGLEPARSGFLPVDDALRTPAEDVWALGDIRGGGLFTHTARDDADVVFRTVFRGQDRSIAGRIVPHAVFVDPEVGAVGLTEPQTRAAGHDVIVGRQDFSGVAKARATGTTRGLIKFVVDAATDRILGCHIAGPDGGNQGVNAAAGGVHRPAG